jgi:hypothetical protein
VTFEQAGRAAIETNYREQLVHLLVAAAAAIDALPELSAAPEMWPRAPRGPAEMSLM